MGLYLELTRWGNGETVANLWKASDEAVRNGLKTSGAHGKADTIIDALGAALAQALEDKR